MNRYTLLFEAQDDIKIGDIVLGGKFKNKKMVVTGFGTDDKNQPTVITDRGTFLLYKVRIVKLMNKA